MDNWKEQRRSVWGQACQSVIAVATRERSEQYVILQGFRAHSSFNGSFFFLIQTLSALNDYALDQEMILSQLFQDKLPNDHTKKVKMSRKLLF